MHKITKVLLGTVAPAAMLVTVMTGSPASAATDHRPCVTRGEYQSVQAGMSSARVKGILDGTGTVLTDRAYGYYEGDWVWDDYEGDYYWDDYAYYYEVKDSVRAYKKCTSWGGGGRIGINFTNYDTDGYFLDYGRQVYEKVPNHAQAEADWIDYLYDSLEEGEYLSPSLMAAGAEAHSPTGDEDRKIPQAPDGRRPAKPTQPPAGS